MVSFFPIGRRAVWSGGRKQPANVPEEKLRHRTAQWRDFFHPEANWIRVAFAMSAVGWGGNHFVPLLAVYRRSLGLHDTTLTAIFGMYALGIVPGLLLGGPTSDRFGRRPLVIASTVLSLLASAVLMTGTWTVLGLYIGRFLIGLAGGGMFAAGSVWVKELSEHASEGASARRATISLSAGFSIGPLVSGILGQWGPHPTLLPYIFHLAVASLAVSLLLSVPETADSMETSRSVLTRLRIRRSILARCMRLLLPTSPWVFGSASIAFTVLPARADSNVGGLTIVFAGAIAAITLGAGIAVQPLAKQLARAGDTYCAIAGLCAVVVGCALGAAAATIHSSILVLTGAIGLGSGYGFCLVFGLSEVTRLARPEELATLVAMNYVLAYAGLAIPYALALLAPSCGYPIALLLAAGVALLCLVAVGTPAGRIDRQRGRRERTTAGSDR